MEQQEPNKTEAQDQIENTEKDSCRKHRCHGKRCGGAGRFFVGALALVGLISLGGMLFGASCGYAGLHHWKNASVSEHLERASERLIDKTDASDEQAAQIKAILQKYEPSLTAMRLDHKPLRETITSVLKQDTVNAYDLEQARQSVFGKLNQSSIEVTQMVAEIANVLTIEQRQELITSMEKRHHRW